MNLKPELEAFHFEILAVGHCLRQKPERSMPVGGKQRALYLARFALRVLCGGAAEVGIACRQEAEQVQSGVHMAVIVVRRVLDGAVGMVVLRGYGGGGRHLRGTTVRQRRQGQREAGCEHCLPERVACRD